MSARQRAVVSAVVCLALPLIAARADAANETADASPLWAGLVPDSAFSATVVYPRRVLTSKAFAKIDIQSLAEDAENQAGFSFLDLEEIVFLFGPMNPQPNVHIADPWMGDIVRLAKPHDHEILLKKWLNDPQRYLIAGHRCYRKAQTANSGEDDVAVCFLDDRTFIIGRQAWLPAMLNAKDAKSPLIPVLSKTDTSADLTEVFINTDTVKEITSGIPTEVLPPPLKPFAEFPNLLSAAKLTIRTSPDISLRLTLIGNDEAAAGELAEMVKSSQQFAQQMLPILQAQEKPSMPRELRVSLEYAAAMAKKLVDGMVPHQSGRQVTVEIRDIGTVDELVSKMILPIRASRNLAVKMTNLKQIGLALANYEAAYAHFPAHAIYSKDGKPLLSWRVSILPYLEEQKLYSEFHLDEPWDSEHNKPLLALMPKIFERPGEAPLAAGLTRFLVPVGKGTMFEGTSGIKASDVTDGLSKTIQIVEVAAEKAVPWSKPVDFDFNSEKPLDGLGNVESGIPAVFGDTHVQILPKLDANTFRWLILRNDGHRVDLNRL
jgi:hypothetical protein